jgi:hypothetical protein
VPDVPEAAVSPAWWAVAGVAAVALALTVWRARMGEAQRRRANGERFVEDTIASIAEVLLLESWLWLPERTREQRNA